MFTSLSRRLDSSQAPDKQGQMASGEKKDNTQTRSPFLSLGPLFISTFLSFFQFHFHIFVENKNLIRSHPCKQMQCRLSNDLWSQKITTYSHTWTASVGVCKSSCIGKTLIHLHVFYHRASIKHPLSHLRTVYPRQLSKLHTVGPV